MRSGKLNKIVESDQKRTVWDQLFDSPAVKNQLFFNQLINVIVITAAQKLHCIVVSIKAACGVDGMLGDRN